MDRDDRPRLEAAGLPEHDLGFSALVGRTLLDDLGQEVVQEVGSEIEARAVSAAARRRPRLLPTSGGTSADLDCFSHCVRQIPLIVICQCVMVRRVGAP